MQDENASPKSVPEKPDEKVVKPTVLRKAKPSTPTHASSSDVTVDVTATKQAAVPPPRPAKPVVPNLTPLDFDADDGKESEEDSFDRTFSAVQKMRDRRNMESTYATTRTISDDARQLIQRARERTGLMPSSQEQSPLITPDEQQMWQTNGASVGMVLRSARERRGVSLDKVRDDLKIRTKFLQALEDGNFDLLPSAVNARGYLRNYANYLDLDSKPLIDQYEALVYDPRSIPLIREGADPNKSPIPPIMDNQFFRPANMDLNPSSGRFGLDTLVRWVIIGALVAAIGLIGYRFYLESRQSTADSSIQTNVEGVESSEPIVADTVSNDFVSTGRNQITEEQLDELEAQSGQSMIDLSQFDGAEAYDIEIEFMQRVWASVETDGEVVFQNYAPEGTILAFHADDQLSIKTGDAYGLYVTLNGEEIGRLGERRQLIDHTFRTR